MPQKKNELRHQNDYDKQSYRDVHQFFFTPYQLDLQLPMQSMPITTNVASSNSPSTEVFSIQHYVIKFVSDLQRDDGFLGILRFSPPIKLTDITEIVLKVMLSTMYQHNMQQAIC